MAPIKRKFASTSACSAKTQKKCSVIEDALSAATSFPLMVRKMMSGNLCDCLGVAKDDGHPVQVKVVEMVGDMLVSMQKGFQKDVDAAEAKLSSAIAQGASCKHAEEAALSEVTAKCQALENAELAANDSARAVEASLATLAAAVSKQVEEDKKLVDAAERKASLEEVFLQSYIPLKEGASTNGQQRKTVAALIALGKDLQFDPSMLTSIPTAFAKAPDDRGTFDALLLETFGAELTEHIKSLEHVLSSSEATKAERASQVLEAKNDVETVQAHSDSCAPQHEQCRVDFAAAKGHHEAAAKTLSQFGPEMKRMEKDLATAKAKLSAFQEGALSCYEELVKLTNTSPPSMVITASKSTQ